MDIPPGCPIIAPPLWLGLARRKLVHLDILSKHLFQFLAHPFSGAGTFLSAPPGIPGLAELRWHRSLSLPPSLQVRRKQFLDESKPLNARS
jgi:hypothetical protein